MMTGEEMLQNITYTPQEKNMSLQRTGCRRIVATAVGVAFSTLTYIIFIFTSPLYSNTDNMTVAMVANGMFGEDNYCQYIHPLLCVATKFLSRLMAGADTFTLITHIVIWTSFAVLTASFMSFWTAGSIESGFKSKSEFESDSNGGSVFGKSVGSAMPLIYCVLYLLFISMGLRIWNANYTIQTACIICAGFLLVFLSQPLQRKGDTPERCTKRNEYIKCIGSIVGIILITFGLLLRIQAALLFIPFVLLEAVTSLLDAVDRKLAFRCLLYWLIPVLSIFLVLQAGRYIFYSREPYRTARRYSDYREIAVDFPMKTWGEAYEGLSGTDTADVSYTVGQEDYDTVCSWVLADTDIIDEKLLADIAEHGRKLKYPLNIQGLRSALAEMKYCAVGLDVYMTLFFILTVLICAWGVLCCSSPWRKIQSILSFAGGMLIMLWFTLRGRALLRVWESVLFAINLITISNVVNARNKNASAASTPTTRGSAARRLSKYVDILLGTVIFICLWFSVGQGIAHTQFTKPSIPLTSRNASEVGESYSAKVVNTDVGEDADIYLWPLWNWQKYVLVEYGKMGKLPPQSIVDHHIPIGDWTYGQPYFVNHLRKISMQNPAKALLERPHTYLVEGANESMLTFMRGHYEGENSEITFREVGMIEDLKVYRAEEVSTAVDQ